MGKQAGALLPQSESRCHYCPERSRPKEFEEMAAAEQDAEKLLTPEGRLFQAEPSARVGTVGRRSFDGKIPSYTGGASRL